MAHGLGFYGDGVIFHGLWKLFWPVILLDPSLVLGSFWRCRHLSAKTDSREDSGQAGKDIWSPSPLDLPPVLLVDGIL